MVTLQILVLSFLVRVQVGQLRAEVPTQSEPLFLCLSAWCEGQMRLPKTVATAGAGRWSGGRFGALFGRGAVLRAAVVSPTAVTAAPFGCLAVWILLYSRAGWSGLRNGGREPVGGCVPERVGNKQGGECLRTLPSCGTRGAFTPAERQPVRCVVWPGCRSPGGGGVGHRGDGGAVWLPRRADSPA